MIHSGYRRDYSPYEICRTTAQLHSLLKDERNHFSVIRVTANVLRNLTTQDYADLSNAGIILWRVK